MGFNLVLLVVGGVMLIGLVLASVLVPLWFAVAAKRDEVAAEIRAELGDAIVHLEPRARSFGLESRGATELTGHGCLALTAAEIVFVQWSPKERLRIARATVTAIEVTDEHLGRKASATLIRLAFRDGDGKTDAVAWLVAEPERLLAALR